MSNLEATLFDVLHTTLKSLGCDSDLAKKMSKSISKDILSTEKISLKNKDHFIDVCEKHLKPVAKLLPHISSMRQKIK